MHSVQGVEIIVYGKITVHYHAQQCDYRARFHSDCTVCTVVTCLIDTADVGQYTERQQSRKPRLEARQHNQLQKCGPAFNFNDPKLINSRDLPGTEITCPTHASITRKNARFLATDSRKDRMQQSNKIYWVQ